MILGENANVISTFESGDETKMVEAWLLQSEPDTLRDDFEDDLLALTEKLVVLNERKVFLEGVASYLGVYEASDTEAMLKEVKCRFAEKGVKFTNTIRDWFQKSNTPSITQKYRRNLYDFCFALGMDYKETAEFFLKSFLTIPYNYKDRVDAVYFYCMKMGRNHDTVIQMLEETQSFEATNPEVDFTEHIGSDIMSITDDEEFLHYLRENCFDRDHQYKTARDKLKEYLEKNKKLAPKDAYGECSPKEMDNGVALKKLLDIVLGFDYMNSEQRGNFNSWGLPTFPRETEIHKVIPKKGTVKDDNSFDVLRKSLILMKFYNFYLDLLDRKKSSYMDKEEISENLRDFREETNAELAECGFVQLYSRNPYDSIILFSANSPNPLDCLRAFIEQRYLQNEQSEE